MPLTRRLRADDFTSNLCWLFVCSRTSFPEPVTRTRLAVPLWVFCFGMSLVLFVCMSVPAAARGCRTAPAVSVVLVFGPPAGPRRERASDGGQEGPFSGGRLLLGLLGLRRSRLGCLRLSLLLQRLGVLVRGDHHDHVPAVLLRVGLDDAELGDVGGQPLEEAVTHLRARLLATAEHHGDLDLVAAPEEALDVALLRLVVVRVDLEAQPHLLDDGERLVPPRLARLLGGLDRKSTRLNSSHANISYAVFCLKKK